MDDVVINNHQKSEFCYACTYCNLISTNEICKRCKNQLSKKDIFTSEEGENERR